MIIDRSSDLLGGNGGGADSRRLRTAVLGCGVGLRHVQAILQLGHAFKLVAVCDRDPGRAAKTSALFRNPPRVFADYAEMLRCESPDLVSVCTPSASHHEHTLAALAAGSHVLCEKPVAGSLRALDCLAEAARSAQRCIFPVFQNRFGGGVRKLRRLVERGITGRRYMTVVETAWRRDRRYYATPWRGTWRDSLGGALLNHAIHAHDLLHYIGGPAIRVSAFAKTLVNPIETEDCSVAALEMEDGSLASLAVTLGSVTELSRMRFCYERLVAESNNHPYALASDPWQFKGADAPVDEEIRRALAEFDPTPEGYEGQYLDVHRAITQGVAASITLADARAAIELTTALYASLETGTAIALPIPTNAAHYGGAPLRRSANPTCQTAFTAG